MIQDKLKFQRLIEKIQPCRVQGLFVYMYFTDKTMNDVQDDTGISRQSLSTWKKGGNVTHMNIEKIANKYALSASSFYDGRVMIQTLIEKEPNPSVRARYGEYLAEYTYLQHAYQTA
tara:strand:+ start:579 stop:929 length:351 start_codon:yes stop_codon:yes gene_type:complete